MKIVIGIFKRILGIFLSLFVSIFSMFGNNNSQDLPALNQIAKTQNDYCNEVGNEIIRCLKENDRQSINNLFCNKVKDTDYLKKKIDIVFNYIDNSGGIVLDDGKWKVGASHGSNDGKGNRTVDYVSCSYSGKIKIFNKDYEIIFTAYTKNLHHNEYQGINCIGLLECRTDEIINEMAKNRNVGEKKKIYLGIDLFSIKYDTFEWKKDSLDYLNENDLYLIPDNLEDDR